MNNPVRGLKNLKIGSYYTYQHKGSETSRDYTDKNLKLIKVINKNPWDGRFISSQVLYFYKEQTGLTRRTHAFAADCGVVPYEGGNYNPYNTLIEESSND